MIRFKTLSAQPFISTFRDHFVKFWMYCLKIAFLSCVFRFPEHLIHFLKDNFRWNMVCFQSLFFFIVLPDFYDTCEKTRIFTLRFNSYQIKCKNIRICSQKYKSHFHWSLRHCKPRWVFMFLCSLLHITQMHTHIQNSLWPKESFKNVLNQILESLILTWSRLGREVVLFFVSLFLIPGKGSRQEINGQEDSQGYSRLPHWFQKKIPIIIICYCHSI